MDKLPLNGLAVVGEIDQLKDHGSTDRVAPLIDETENVHGGAPLVQSPLTCGSGALSAAVNDFDTVLLAHEPPGALCETSIVTFGTSTPELAPESLGRNTFTTKVEVGSRCSGTMTENSGAGVTGLVPDRLARRAFLVDRPPPVAMVSVEKYSASTMLMPGRW